MYFSYCLRAILMVCFSIQMMSHLKLQIAMRKTQIAMKKTQISMRKTLIAMRRATGLDQI